MGQAVPPAVTLLNLDVGTEDPHPAPLGLLYLASFLESRDVSVEIRNYESCVDDDLLAPETLCRFLDGCGKVIGIAAMSAAMPLLLARIDDIAAAFPDRTLILGGYGPSIDPELILRDFSSVDFIISGWAEESFADLVENRDDPAKLAGIPGLTYRDGPDIRTVPPRRKNFDVDALPTPAHHLVGFGRPDTSIPVVSARGCPSNCAFCDIASNGRGRMHTRNLDLVLDEVEQVKSMKLDLLEQEGVDIRKVVIGIVDDTFCIRRRRVLEFCDKLVQRGIDIEWRIAARVDQVDGEMLARMAETGCRAVFFGIESGSDRLLREISKGFDSEEAYRVVLEATTHIETVSASFIWGLPSETFDDFKETVLIMSMLRDAGAVVASHLWSPLPRSRLYAENRNRLRLSPEFVSDIAGLTRTTLLERFREVVVAYPHLCSSFYHYPHADLVRRAETLEGLDF
jgi:radical SAM superfamily enzyme YgiQ (UPF0313 family)